MLRLLGIDPRAFSALVRAFILMDLRGQHYAAATASKPVYVLSPLFIVVGQFLACSALLCGFLYARVDVFFFAFANLTLSMLLLATTVVVEFQEVVLSPSDLAIIGHRPVPPRTYAAARLTNLLFYFGLMFLALTLIPTVCGATLRDAGWWFGPAYFLASLTGNLGLLAVMVLVLASFDHNQGMQTLKAVLSWSQIILIMVLFYGGQLLVRGGLWGLQVWGAFPPPWTQHLPPTWLARFVERAACEPDATVGWQALALLGMSGAACLVVGVRLTMLYRRMQPIEQAAAVRLPMAPERVGGLGGPGWLARTPEERVGYWMGLTFLWRDPGLTLRCLFAFQLTLAIAVVGLVSGQFDNPLRETDPQKTALALLAFFLLPMGAPNLVFNLSYSRDSHGGWLLRTAPVERPLDLARGACKAVMLWVVTPLCVVLGVAAAVAWRDPLSAALHAGLAWGLTWVFILASLWLICPAWPFSLPPARGGSLALPPLPMLALGTVATTLGLIHAKAAIHPVYWVVAFGALPLAGWLVSRQAARWMARLGAPG